MRLMYGLPICALLLALCSPCIGHPERLREKKKTSVLLASEDDPKEAFDFGSVGVSLDDLLPFPPPSSLAPPAEATLSPGEEFVDERPSPENKGGKLYEQALKSIRKGYGYGEEEKKAAYRLIDQAAQLGHPDAKKLMGFAHLFGDWASFAPDEARKMFTELAANGSADANLGLGFMYSVGLGVERDPAKAHMHYSFAAMGGSPLAKMAMGYRYLFGVGVPRHCPTALHYFKDAAFAVADRITFSGGVASHRIHLTDGKIRRPNGKELPPVLEQNHLDYYRFLSSSKNDPEAQYAMGRLHLIGNRGIQQDFKVAQKYLHLAAESGHAEAAAELGKMYLDGTHATPQNNATAFKLFLQAAEKKLSLAYTGLGVMYLQGDGVRVDHFKAAKLFRLAADQGEGEGQLFLGGMYIKGFGVERDMKSAFKYFQMAAKNSQVLAWYNLGIMHEAGIGVLLSCPIAAELFKNVAERGRWAERLTEAYVDHRNGRSDEAALKYLFLAELGYEPAQTNYAHLLDAALTTPAVSRNETFSRALEQWLRAANQDQVVARVKVGDYYYYGQGVGNDYKSAVRHYEKAAERHRSAQSMFNLGYMYEQGQGVPKDLHIAKRYYDKAAEESADAYAPVHLALMNLQLKFYVEAINQWAGFEFLDSVLGTSWDLVLMALLAISAGLVLQAVMRRRGEEQLDF